MKYQKIFNILIIFWLVYLSFTPKTEVVYKIMPELSHDTIYIEEQIRFDTMQATVANMYKVCDSLGIKFPKIVVSQAILESGHFKSPLFKRSNNPLGLYDSKNRRYYEFVHWTDAITAYKNMIEYKHKDGENYYDFLERINYAEDKEYISRIKRIEKRL